MVTFTREDEALKGLGQSTHVGRAHPTTLPRMPSQCETTGQDLRGVGRMAGKAHQSGYGTGVHGCLACPTSQRRSLPASAEQYWAACTKPQDKRHATLLSAMPHQCT